jgi:hypothetical protein
MKKDCRSKPKEDSKFRMLGYTIGKEDLWAADGGESFHMTANYSYFKTYEQLDFPLEINMANGEPIKAIAKGNINCLVHNGKDRVQNTHIDVYHVPDLGSSLFSEGAAIDRGNSIMKFANRLEVWDSQGKKICTRTREPGELWTLNLKVIRNRKAYSAKASDVVWHKRLGHTSKEKLDLMINK